MTPTTRASKTPARRDGSTQVAHVVFGGTLVGAVLLAGALWALSGPPSALWATAAAAVGTVLAALLWSRGWQGPACRAHTTALLLAGALLPLTPISAIQKSVSSAILTSFSFV